MKNDETNAPGNGRDQNNGTSAEDNGGDLSVSFKEHFSGRMDRLEQDFRFVKQVFGSIAVIIALVTAASSIFGLSTGASIQNHETKLKDLKESLEATSIEYGALVDHQRRRLVDQCIIDVDEFVNTLSLSMVDAKIYDRLERNQKSFHDLSDPPRQTQLSDDETGAIYRLLEDMTTGLMKLYDLKKEEEAQVNASINRSLDDLQQWWKDVKLDLHFETGRNSRFVKRCQAYRENFLGYLQLKRAHMLQYECEECLDEAKKHFDAAIRVHSPFARAQSNLAIVESYRYRRLVNQKPRPASSVLINALRNVETQYEKALQSARAERTRSNILNNLADLHLKKALLFFEDLEQVSEATAEHKMAEKYVQRSIRCLRARSKITWSFSLVWRESVVPIAMESVWCQSESTQLFFGDLDSGFVVVGVQGCLDDESTLCGRAGDQIDNGLMAQQGASTPVLGDEAEKSMLDLVPLARPRREVADMQA